MEQPPHDISPEAKEHAPRNFLVLTLHTVLFRIGWVFKTESILMPGFLHTLTPSGAIRGFLPLISRFGQSIPPLIAAHWITKRSVKKWVFFSTALLVCLPWGILAVLILVASEGHRTLMVLAFLILYAFHWLVCGIVNLLHGTMLGKLIPVLKRGRFVGLSELLRGLFAVAAVFVLMPAWLDEGVIGYSKIFGATGFFFLLGALSLLGIEEPVDDTSANDGTLWEFVLGLVHLVRQDRNFRRLIGVIVLFYVNLLLFPHYTVFGMETLRLGEESFVGFLIAQAGANALISPLSGHIADRRGNRITLQGLIFLSACVPLAAVGISTLPLHLGRRLYWIVFACIGFIPVSQRITTNYVLEMAPQSLHAQYLGTLNLVRMLPVLISPIVGWAMDLFSFQPVLLVCSGLIFCSGVMTFWLKEPRLALLQTR